MLFTLLKGNNLYETIHWNLIPMNQVSMPTGKPIWEYDLDHLSQNEKSEIPHSWFGRLVPLTRAIKIDENNRNLILANALTYPKLPKIREPMGSVIVSKKGKTKSEWKYVRTDPNQHPWRNLHAILAHGERDKNGGAGGASVLNNIVNIRSFRKLDRYELWIGGISSDKAKIIDTAKWTIQMDTDLNGTSPLDANVLISASLLSHH